MKWRNIKGLNGRYQVSNQGDVRSVHHYKKNNGKQSTKRLKQSITKWGYLAIPLSNGYKHKTYLVHRLVAKAFIPNPHNYKFINHKDCNRLDNRVFNLEWCTRLYNNNYGNHRELQSLANDHYEIILSKNGNQKVFGSNYLAGKWLKKHYHLKTSLKSIKDYIHDCCYNHLGNHTCYGYYAKHGRYIKN